MEDWKTLALVQNSLQSWLKNTIGHAVSVSIKIAVFRLPIFVRKKHHTDLNFKFVLLCSWWIIVDLITCIAPSLLSFKLTQGIFCCLGKTWGYLNISVSASLKNVPLTITTICYLIRIDHTPQVWLCQSSE